MRAINNFWELIVYTIIKYNLNIYESLQRNVVTWWKKTQQNTCTWSEHQDDIKQTTQVLVPRGNYCMRQIILKKKQNIQCILFLTIQVTPVLLN